MITSRVEGLIQCTERYLRESPFHHYRHSSASRLALLLAYLVECCGVEADDRNTKTGLYLDAIHSSKVFNKIIDSTPSPNAMTRLEEVDRDQTCLLGVAGDVVMMLIHGLLDIEGVEKCLGEVESAELEVCLLISVDL
jgi:hypothetical protein